MAKTILKDYFSKGTKHKTLTKITSLMFFLLVAEKFTSCISAAFWQGTAPFEFNATLFDVFCMLIYFTMAVLIAKKVDYKYLLIPDALLLLLKLYHMVEGFVTLFPLEENDILTKVTAIEEITENFLFIVFLMIFFSGKILRKMHGRTKVFIPYVCIISLIFTFPSTVVLEIVKLLIEAEFFSLPLRTMWFNFIKNIINEIFLDFPYFMLVLMVYFKPHNKHHH